MRRFKLAVLALVLAAAATGCGSMVVNVPQPRAARMSFKNNRVFWSSWDKQSVPLPATVNLRSHTLGKGYIARITDVPLQPGVTVYMRIKTYGNTDFSKAGQVPLTITPEDIQDVIRGNVVRIVVIDPKRRYQTSRFVQLRLSPTQDALEEGKRIGEPLALVTLGNREPKFIDLFSSRKAASY